MEKPYSANQIYSGTGLTQAVVVKDGNTTLTNGTHYTIAYKNNTNAGTATVTITGVGDYTGSVDKTFTINKAAQSITAKSSLATVSVGKTATVSTTGAKGTVTYTSSDATVATVDSKTGVVTAKKVGTVTITAKSAATANYNAASKAVTIKVLPAATASLSAANLSTGIKLTWKKVAGANGYIIYRNGSKSKSFSSGNKTATITKNTILNRTIGSLTKGKKYYVRVRCFKTVSGKKYYSGWSAVKAVTVKK